MNAFLSQYESLIRFIFFLGFLAALTLWENRLVWRPWRMTRKQRWINHLALAGLSVVLIRLVFPALAVLTAINIQGQELGLLATVDWPVPIKVILTVVMLDFIIYLQHRVLHYVPLFWRFHQVHHCDTELDVTTGIRFHPVELLFSMLIKILGVVFIGGHPLGVLCFEILLNFGALFTHTNAKMPMVIETPLRWLIVTPAMHRVHHSDLDHERNSNFGFFFSMWDRLLGTYRPYPQMGYPKMTLGLAWYRELKYQELWSLLSIPFYRMRKKRSRKTQPKASMPVEMETTSQDKGTTANRKD